MTLLKKNIFKIIVILIYGFLLLSCSSVSYLNHCYNLKNEMELSDYANLNENAVLDFDGDKLFYCIPILNTDLSLKKSLIYGYGNYKIDYEKKIIVINNEKCSRFRLPTRSFYKELNARHLKKNEYHFKIIDNNNNPVQFMSSNYLFKNDKIVDILPQNLVPTDYTIFISQEKKLLCSEIRIYDFCSGSGNLLANLFDPLIIDISNKNKGNYLIVLHKQNSFMKMNKSQTYIQFTKIKKTKNKKEALLVNFKDNSCQTLLKSIE